MATNEVVVVICSIADGSEKSVFRAARGQQLRIALVARDDRSILVRQSSGNDGAIGYWCVPLDGRPSNQLKELAGLNVQRLGWEISDFALHTDGRRLAFEVRNRKKSSDQVFVLENFLPNPAAGRGGGGGR